MRIANSEQVPLITKVILTTLQFLFKDSFIKTNFDLSDSTCTSHPKTQSFWEVQPHMILMAQNHLLQLVSYVLLDFHHQDSDIVDVSECVFVFCCS